MTNYALGLFPRRWPHGSFSNAAQPDFAPDGVAQLSYIPGCAEQPSFILLSEDTSELTVAFYNVGIQQKRVEVTIVNRRKKHSGNT